LSHHLISTDVPSLLSILSAQPTTCLSRVVCVSSNACLFVLEQQNGSMRVTSR
jgi:hypothetical protein